MKIGLRKTLNLLSTRMANNGKYAAIDQGVISIANFAASILLARLVSPTELGMYVIGFLAIYFIRAIQDGLIIQPLNTFGASKTDEEFRAYFSAAAVHQLILSGISAVVAAGMGWMLTRSGNDTLGPTIFALWFCFLTWQLQEFLRRAFYTRGEVSKAVWLSLCANLIRLGLMIVLSRNQQITGLTGLNAIGWGSLAAVMIGIGLAKSFFSHRPGHVLTIWRENWQFGRWILGASLSEWVVVHLYPIILAGMISFAATGVYQTLQNLVAPIHVLLRAIDTFTTPILAKTFDQSGFPKFKRDLKRIYLFSGIPILGFLLLVVLFTPQLLFLLAKDTYLPYADGIYVMALFYFLLFINRPLQLAFRAIRKGKQIFVANILAMVSMFTVGIWLIDRWGIYGGIGGQALNAFIIILVLGIAWVKLSKTAENIESSLN